MLVFPQELVTCSSCGSSCASHRGSPGLGDKGCAEVLSICRVRLALVQPPHRGLRQVLSKAPAVVALRAQPFPKVFDTTGT